MAGQKKHVIFLGAGASFTSGYPVGDKLRLRLSSDKHFETELDKQFPKNRHGLKFQAGDETSVACMQYFGKFKNAIELFRHGGFATVDEFSKLAAEKHPDYTQDMKKLMQLAFALHNPEDSFHDSDYYPFIQRLFTGDLHSLRNDVTILSYNYDCYLDYLLLKAFGHRKRLSHQPEITDCDKNRLTSGFYDLKNGDWLQKRGFNYLKLHGSIARVQDGLLTHKRLFATEVHERLKIFGEFNYNDVVPPIVFPWELFASRDKFVNAEEFIFVSYAKSDEQLRAADALFKLYKAIWEKAKNAIMEASKVSFVGISMHPYLADGLAYLFNGKAGDLEIVVANPENGEFPNVSDRLHSGTFAGRTLRILKQIAPVLNPIQSSSEAPDPHAINLKYSSGVTLRKTFREFIEKEMV